jgi:hypothetical protein
MAANSRIFSIALDLVWILRALVAGVLLCILLRMSEKALVERLVCVRTVLRPSSWLCQTCLKVLDGASINSDTTHASSVFPRLVRATATRKFLRRRNLMGFGSNSIQIDVEDRRNEEKRDRCLQARSDLQVPRTLLSCLWLKVQGVIPETWASARS